MLHSLAALYAAGSPVDWSAFDRDFSRRRLVLPTYPFERQRYWSESSDNGHAPVPSSSPIVQLIEQGDTHSLAQLLSQSATLSEDQSRWLPQLLNLLVEHHQHQRSSLLHRIGSTTSSGSCNSSSPPSSPEPEPGLWLILAHSGSLARDLAALENSKATLPSWSMPPTGSRKSHPHLESSIPPAPMTSSVSSTMSPAARRFP